MSAWRRKALALVPQHRLEFARPDFLLHEVFFRLEQDARDAHIAEMEGSPDAVPTLQRIHGFAGVVPPPGRPALGAGGHRVL